MWSLHKKLAVTSDRWFVPLATTDLDVLLELTKEREESRAELAGILETRKGKTSAAA